MRIESVDERVIPPALRAALGDLLADAYALERFRRHAYFGVPPDLRVMGVEGDELVGQLSVWRIKSDPPLRVFGLGHSAVRPARRRRGVARTLIREAARLCRARGAEVIVARTTVVRGVLSELDFAPVEIAAAEGTDWMAWSRTALPDFRSLEPNGV